MTSSEPTTTSRPTMPANEPSVQNWTEPISGVRAAATAKAVTAAKALGDVTVLCAGASAAEAAKTAATIDGVAKVLVAEDASLGHRLAGILEWLATLSLPVLIWGLVLGWRELRARWRAAEAATASP